jgi:hypothetical protein
MRFPVVALALLALSGCAHNAQVGLESGFRNNVKAPTASEQLCIRDNYMCHELIQNLGASPGPFFPDAR